jgi:Flp pilus assembly protein TadG
MSKFFSKSFRSQTPSLSRDMRGAALVECAMVFPLLLLMLSGVLEIARALNELTWVARTAYSSAIVAAGTPGNIAGKMLESRFSQIKSIKDGHFVGRLTMNNPSPSIGSSYYDAVNNTISMKFTATLQPLVNVPFSIPIPMTITAPFLMFKDINYSSLGSFQSPAHRYDCAGAVCTTCPLSCSYSVS